MKLYSRINRVNKLRMPNSGNSSLMISNDSNQANRNHIVITKFCKIDGLDDVYAATEKPHSKQTTYK